MFLLPLNNMPTLVAFRISSSVGAEVPHSASTERIASSSQKTPASTILVAPVAASRDGRLFSDPLPSAILPYSAGGPVPRLGLGEVAALAAKAGDDGKQGLALGEVVSVNHHNAYLVVPTLLRIEIALEVPTVAAHDRKVWAANRRFGPAS